MSNLAQRFHLRLLAASEEHWAKANGYADLVRQADDNSEAVTFEAYRQAHKQTSLELRALAGELITEALKEACA